VDLAALRAFLAPLAEPSKVDSFKFSREWLRNEATRFTDLRSSSIARRLNLPPSYLLIHRVSTAGVGVLCQLECEGPFRAEVLQWMPGYTEPAEPAAPGQPPGSARTARPAADGSAAKPARRAQPRRRPKPAARRPAAQPTTVQPTTVAPPAARSAAARSAAAPQRYVPEPPA